MPGREDVEIDQTPLTDEPPIASADRFDVASGWTSWVVFRRSRKIIPIKPIGTPLPNVASHVMEAEWIGLETADWADEKLDYAGRLSG